MTNKISERLEIVLSGRKMHPWGIKIGLSKTVISRLKQGIFPVADRLLPIIKAENVSLNWLIDGTGQPFMLDYCSSDEDCATKLNALYNKEWKTHIVVDGINIAMVLTRPGSYNIDDVTYLNTAVQVLVGRIGNRAIQVIADNATDSNTFFVETSTTDMRYLYNGQTGTYGILHTSDALLNKSQPLIKTGVQSFVNTNEVAEPLTPYGVGKISSDEMATVEDLRLLDSKNLVQIRAVIRSLADKADSETK